MDGMGEVVAEEEGCAGDLTSVVGGCFLDLMLVMVMVLFVF